VDAGSQVSLRASWDIVAEDGERTDSRAVVARVAGHWRDVLLERAVQRPRAAALEREGLSAQLLAILGVEEALEDDDDQ
jgi:hypothetical protein